MWNLKELLTNAAHFPQTVKRKEEVTRDIRVVLSPACRGHVVVPVVRITPRNGCTPFGLFQCISGPFGVAGVVGFVLCVGIVQEQWQIRYDRSCNGMSTIQGEIICALCCWLRAKHFCNGVLLRAVVTESETLSKAWTYE